jgi:hypothetical protein
MLDQWAFRIYGAHLWWKQWLEKVILRWRWLVRDLVVQWSFAPLLAEGVQVVLHLLEPRSLSVNIFPTSFSTLHRGLPSQNGFLFLSESFNFLLDTG